MTEQKFNEMQREADIATEYATGEREDEDEEYWHDVL